jgi:hypothetical protein
VIVDVIVSSGRHVANVIDVNVLVFVCGGFTFGIVEVNEERSQWRLQKHGIHEAVVGRLKQEDEFLPVAKRMISATFMTKSIDCRQL